MSNHNQEPTDQSPNMDPQHRTSYGVRVPSRKTVARRWGTAGLFLAASVGGAVAGTQASDHHVGEHRVHVTTPKHGHEGSKPASIGIDPQAMSTVEVIKNGQASVAPMNISTYPAETQFYKAPVDMSQAGGGESNSAGIVPEGYKLVVKGQIIAQNPNDAIGVNPYQPVFLSINGGHELVWVKYSVDANNGVDPNEPVNSPTAYKYDQGINFNDQTGEMLVHQFVNGDPQTVPIGVGEIVPDHQS